MRALRVSSVFALSAKTLEGIDTAPLWWKVLEAQTHLYFGADLKVLKSVLPDAERPSVIDLGSGTGDFLLKLADHLPYSRLTGIEISADHISVAKTRSRSLPHVSFQKADIFDLPAEKYDLATMRLVLQHLSDHEAVLGVFRRAIKRGGHVFIMEACDELTHFQPEVPELKKLYKELRKNQERCGGNRNSITDFKRVLEGSEFEIVIEKRQAVRFARSEEKSQIISLYAHVAEVVRRKFSVDVNIDKLIRELSEWTNNPTATGQIGMAHLVLKRKR